MQQIGTWFTENNTAETMLCIYAKSSELEQEGMKPLKTNSLGFCTHYEWIPYTTSYMTRTEEAISGYTDDTIAFVITTDNATTEEEWTEIIRGEALSRRPVTIYYELKTPTYESIRLPQLHTTGGTINLTVEGASKIEITYENK